MRISEPRMGRIHTDASEKFTRRSVVCGIFPSVGSFFREASDARKRQVSYIEHVSYMKLSVPILCVFEQKVAKKAKNFSGFALFPLFSPVQNPHRKRRGLRQLATVIRHSAFVTQNSSLKMPSFHERMPFYGFSWKVSPSIMPVSPTKL